MVPGRSDPLMYQMEALGYMVSVLTYKGTRNESHLFALQEGMGTTGQPCGKHVIEPHDTSAHRGAG